MYQPKLLILKFWLTRSYVTRIVGHFITFSLLMLFLMSFPNILVNGEKLALNAL